MVYLTQFSTDFNSLGLTIWVRVRFILHVYIEKNLKDNQRIFFLFWSKSDTFWDTQFIAK